ncbi:MAG: hypothetical protein F2836_04150 [Actinobacteria bacterium]|nr:hypothetical protein [Actinomycetota bacterium]
MKMPKLGVGEAPQLSVGGALATGAHKVGGFLGHTGRIIDNTDKGAEELAAGKPGLGLVKSTAALGVWGSRKVLGAPLKSIPIPLMDQLGGEVGKAVYSAGGLMVEGAGKAVRGLTERKAMEQRRAHAYRDFVGETSKDEDGEAIERGVVDASGHQAGDTNESLEALRSDFVGGEGQGEGGERVGQNWQSLRNRVLAQGVTFGPQFAKQGIEKDRSAWTNYRQGDVRDEVVDGVRVPYKDKNLNDDTTAPVSIKDTMTASDKRSANAAGLPQQSIGWGEYMKMRLADRANKAENDLAEYATLPRDQAKKAGGLLWQGLTSAGGDSAWTGPKIRHAHRDASEVPNVPEGWAAMDAEQRKAHVGEEKWGSHEATYRRERQAGHDDKLIWDNQAMEAGSKPGFFRKLLLGDRRERIPRTRMVKDENTQEMRKEWLRSPRVNFNGRSNMLKPDDPRLQYHGQSGVDALTKSLDGYIATREFGTRMPDPVPEPAPEANLAKARAKGAEMLQKAQVARMDTDAFGARAVQDKAVKDQIKHWMGTAKNLPVGDGQGPDFDVNDDEGHGEAERASVQGNPVFDRPDFDVDDDEGSGAFGGISLAGSESQGSDPRPREDDARFKDKGSGEGMNYVSAFESELDAWKARNPGRT